MSDDYFDPEAQDDHGQNLEQMEANVNEVGKVVARYFKNLQEQGFTNEQAFKLASGWHDSFWAAAHIPPDEMWDDDEWYDAEDDEDEDDGGSDRIEQ